MEYVSKDNKNKLDIVLESSNEDLDGRWIVHDIPFFEKKEKGNSVSGFARLYPKDWSLARTHVALCEDYFMDRIVVAKTARYFFKECSDEKTIQLKRKHLAAQIELLNSIKSNMLPEPLDFFCVKNTIDTFGKGISKEIRETEPVLILDYFPGEILSTKLSNRFDKTFYRMEEGTPFEKKPENLNVSMVMRLAGDILSFLIELYEKGYAYTSLSTDHIILLGDNKPRFVGIGRICPIHNDTFDCDHVNYGRQLKGYSGPEMNTVENLYGLHSSVKSNIAFNFGALITRIVLADNNFKERNIAEGAHNYACATEDREIVKRASKQLDDLLLKLMNMDSRNRLTDFDVIMKELLIISGDASRPRDLSNLHHGVVKFMAYDKGFGFITDNQGYDVHVSINYVQNMPRVWEGSRVSYFVKPSNRGGFEATEFYDATTRTDVVYPRFVPKPEPVVMKPQPKPTPKPAPQPTPQPVYQPRPQPVPQPKPQPQQKTWWQKFWGL